MNISNPLSTNSIESSLRIKLMAGRESGKTTLPSTSEPIKKFS